MPTILTRATVRVLTWLTRHGRWKAWLHRIAVSYKQEQISLAIAPGLDVPEILPINLRMDRDRQQTRINLMLPALSSRHVFGGIETALQVFDDLRCHFDRARIIVTDESSLKPKIDAYYSHWPILELDDEPISADHIVAAGSRWNKTLAVSECDYFMATAWWTAHNSFGILDWQRRHFPLTIQPRLIYLIQDFEPGFYPWSTRYVLAQATYAKPERTVAVVNSEQLAAYLVAQGYQFPLQHILQPRLHPKLAVDRLRYERFQKERQLLVYGRPGTERNAFSLIVAALRIWAQEYGLASQWRVVSAGEPFAPVDLGGSCQLTSVGKVSIQEYAILLSQSAIGLSLMVSPHPSYPPLEMAAFGINVVTNGFATKNLASVSTFVTSVNSLDPSSLAHALGTLAHRFDTASADQWAVARADVDVSWQDDFLKTQIQPRDWMPAVAAAILGSSDSSTI